MSTLLQIAPSSEVVSIRGTDVEVTGISAKGIAVLFSRFPELLSLFDGNVDKITPDLILTLGGDVVAAIIASGCGMPGNVEAEQIAINLPIESQLELMGAIKRQTMPGGPERFFQVLRELGLDLAKEESSSKQSSSDSVATAGGPILNGSDGAQLALSLPQR